MARKPAAKADKSASLSNIPEFSKDEELKAYRDMLLIRRFEEKAGQMYGMGLIGGFCHLYIGQEAVVTGITMASQKGDAQITGYRDHGHMLVMGLDPKGVMAELTGRAGRPVARARAARCTCSPTSIASMAATASSARRCRSAPGSRSPPSTGARTPSALTYFGDGAANQGQVYESFNMAKLWNLPVVYIIENNRYAMGTSVERATAQPDFSQARPELRHRRRAGRRHGRPAGARRRQARHRPCPRRRRPVHPRDDDLPLSRPLDVRSGEVSLQGRSDDDARRARPDRAGQEPHSGKALRHRGKR